MTIQPDIEQSIEAKIKAAFNPLSFRLVNESGKHKGHAGDDGTGQTHFRLEIVSAAFAGKTRVESQRMVYGLLDEEFKRGLHALALKLSAP